MELRFPRFIKKLQERGASHVERSRNTGIPDSTIQDWLAGNVPVALQRVASPHNRDLFDALAEDMAALSDTPAAADAS